METTAYAHKVELDIPYEQAIAKATEKLKEQGFGVLTEIDIKAKLKEKTGADFRRYVILGACNPPLAHQALQAELEVGILLPCNVIVYETDPGHSVVAAMAPQAAMAAVGDNPALAAVAREADVKIRKAMTALEDELVGSVP
jgi:uncharacterized protein (DUF302 family)